MRVESWRRCDGKTSANFSLVWVYASSLAWRCVLRGVAKWEVAREGQDGREEGKQLLRSSFLGTRVSTTELGTQFWRQ